MAMSPASSRSSTRKMPTTATSWFTSGASRSSTQACFCPTVRSKWGMVHLWRHVLQEVPAGYGDRVRFFQRLPAERCVELFLEYAEAMGFRA
jgi:hypothetical protein